MTLPYSLYDLSNIKISNHRYIMKNYYKKFTIFRVFFFTKLYQGLEIQALIKRAKYIKII